MLDLFELVATTTDAVWAVDRQQRIVLWNEGAERTLGYVACAVRGRPCYEIIGGRDEGGCAVCSRHCLPSRAAETGELVPTREVRVLTRAGRPLWLSVTTLVVPSRWRELSLLMHLARDVDRRRSMEQVAESLLAGLDRGASESVALGPGAAKRGALTGREREVLRLLSCGASSKRIAAELAISVATARNHVQRILAKLQVHSRLEAVALAVRGGLVPTVPAGPRYVPRRDEVPDPREA